MHDDPFAQFKVVQREGWASFSPWAVFTTAPAARLVEYAGVRDSVDVLDVACGTGVVAITAARRGVRVCGVDLSPALIEDAKRSAAVIGTSIDFVEGDVEALPYPDSTFDIVLSQFGHMFAPRPEAAVREMLRVLRPGGRVAFSTWPPEVFVGRMFSLVAKYLPLPSGVAPPQSWGDPNIVRERLGDSVVDLEFDRDEFSIPALSPQHYRSNAERTIAPVAKIVANLATESAQLAGFRKEYDALTQTWFSCNQVRQSYLLTRATKK
jgi:SAM-dependent methyltransferase